MYRYVLGDLNLFALLDFDGIKAASAAVPVIDMPQSRHNIANTMAIAEAAAAAAAAAAVAQMIK